MSGISTDLLEILQFLFLGFLTAWIFYGFTPYKKPSPFERIVQALVYTMIIQAFVFLLNKVALGIGKYRSYGVWDANSEIVVSMIISILLGFILAYFTNTNKFHYPFTLLTISYTGSYPSEWYWAFKEEVTYIVLHLSGERRIYGWPNEWPTYPGSGYFKLTNARWLVGREEIKLSGVNNILIPASEVVFVEFMEKTWENKNGNKDTESTTTNDY
jgi:hypothetical protein